jgi:quercetin dioxygenase-like cupin family protein
MSAFGLGSDDGEAFWFLDQLATIKIGTHETQGRWALVELVTPPGSGPPLHVHRNDDEAFYILEGEITFYVGDAVIEAKAGSFAFAPRNVPHTFVVGTTSPARYLVVAEPAGFDRFVTEVGIPAETRTLPPPSDGPPDVAALGAVAAKYGIEILGPPGPPPTS